VVAVVAKRKAKKDPSVFSATSPSPSRVIGITLLGRRLFESDRLLDGRMMKNQRIQRGVRNLPGLDRLLIGINRNTFLVMKAIQAEAFFSCMWVAWHPESRKSGRMPVGK